MKVEQLVQAVRFDLIEDFSSSDYEETTEETIMTQIKQLQKEKNKLKQTAYDHTCQFGKRWLCKVRTRPDLQRLPGARMEECHLTDEWP